MKYTLLLVEDDKDLHETLKTLFVDNGFSVSSAFNGAAALQTALSNPPDIVVLDLGLPDMTGESVCTQIKKQYPQLPVIILTARNTTVDIVHGLSLGADDYMAKPFAVEELLARINARLRQGKNSNDTILRIDDLELDRNKIQVKRAGNEIKLTQHEFSLLEYLMLNEGRVLSRDMILSRAWSYASDTSSRAVDVYIGYLRSKIDSSSNKKLIHSVRGFGYVLRP